MKHKGETRKTGPPVMLRYRVKAPDGQLDAIAFVDHIKETVQVLRQSAEDAEGRNVPVQYLVHEIEKRSPATVILLPRVRLADAEIVKKAQERHVHVINELVVGRIPTGVNYGALRRYRRLGAIAEGHSFVADVKVNGAKAQITGSLMHKLDLELQKDQWAVGTVRGFIRSYQSARAQRLIRIYPHVGPSLEARFKISDQAKVRELIDTYVEASGRMRYRPKAYHPYYMDIQTIRHLDTADSPTFADMDGALEDFGGDASSEDLVRERRDAW